MRRSYPRLVHFGHHATPSVPLQKPGCVKLSILGLNRDKADVKGKVRLVQRVRLTRFSHKARV